MKIGEKAIVLENKSLTDIKRRLQDIGLVENTVVERVLESPFGDPSAYDIRGATIAIRNENAKKILIKKI